MANWKHGWPLANCHPSKDRCEFGFQVLLGLEIVFLIAL
jgi:hypothetical protein